MLNLIKSFIIESLAEQQEIEKRKKPDREDDLLIEPDFSKDEEEDNAKNEISAVAGAAGGAPAIRGATTPLGTGPGYPGPKAQSDKKRIRTAAKFFGGAKPVGKTKKKKKKVAPNT